MRRICRIINILEVAMKFVAEYVQVKSEVEFLCCNKYALRCIFRGFVESFLGQSSYANNKLADSPSVRCEKFTLENIIQLRNVVLTAERCG